MAATDKGGGLRGEGGTLNDSQDAAVTPPATGFVQVGFTIYPVTKERELGTLTDPNAGTETPDDDAAAAPVRQYLVVEELADRVLGERIKDDNTFTGEGDPEQILIAKAHSARRSVWEDETVNGILYNYPEEVNHSLRIATRPGEDQELNPPVYQRYVPPYIAGISIIYAVESEDGTEVGATKLVDMNVDGRTWAVERPLTVEELP